MFGRATLSLNLSRVRIETNMENDLINIGELLVTTNMIMIGGITFVEVDIRASGGIRSPLARGPT